MKYLILFILFSINIYSQGTNCANAIPLTIPTTVSGTTCGNGNNYNGINGCVNTTASVFPYGGQDIIYSYTATEEGIVNFTFGNIVSGCGTVPQPYFNVFSDCPGIAGACVSRTQGFTSSTVTGLFQVIPGQTYYILIDAHLLSFINYCPCFSFQFSLSFTQLPLNQDCNNAGFENGFTGWFATSGRTNHAPPGSATPLYTPQNSGFIVGRHTIMNNPLVNDPCGNFSTVSPLGGSSVRLGNNNTGAQGEQLIYRFTVSESNANLTYWYAVVFQDAGHPTQEQPFFKAVIRNQLGQIIPCSDFVVAANVNLPGFFWSTSCTGIQYKPWSMVNVNLSEYIGQNVTLEFTTGDCSQSGHYGYAYIDIECQPLIIPNTPIEICEGDNITLTAPNGYIAYNWQPLNQNTQSININASITDIITLNVTNINGCINNYQYSFIEGPCCVNTNLNIYEN